MAVPLVQLQGAGEGGAVIAGGLLRGRGESRAWGNGDAALTHSPASLQNPQLKPGKCRATV